MNIEELLANKDKQFLMDSSNIYDYDKVKRYIEFEVKKYFISHGKPEFVINFVNAKLSKMKLVQKDVITNTEKTMEKIFGDEA